MKQSVGKKPAVIPTPLLVIGTYDSTGKANVMTAAWGGICSGDPLSVAFSVQKPRHTYQALLEKMECTISIPTAKYIKEVDFFGTNSGKNIDKFSATGLTPEKAEKVNAPGVSEFPIVLECKITQTIEIGIHVQFIAEVVDVKIDSDLISPEGKINTEDTTFVYYDPIVRKYISSGKTLMPAFTILKTSDL